MSQALKPQWFQILFALSQGPLHGSAIMEEILEHTHGNMKLWPATLYGSLRDLEREGWIEETEAVPGVPTEGGRRRFYALSPQGKEVLSTQLHQLREILDIAYARNLIADPRATT